MAVLVNFYNTNGYLREKRLFSRTFIWHPVVSLLKLTTILGLQHIADQELHDTTEYLII